jgi:DHA3 family macrolide efflux protein-like MFS transporter
MHPTDQNDMQNWKRTAALFLFSQNISLFGSSLVQYAIWWYVVLNTQSGIMITVAVLCGFLPTFILSPIAGVWADRYNRKMLIVLADALVAAATLILAITFLLGYEALWLLFFMYAIRAVGTGIQSPAVGAILPQFVPADKLTRINGINGTIQAVTFIASPAISALLLTVTAIEMVFFIDVITAALAIITMLFFINIPVHAKALQTQTSKYFSDLKSGWDYINNHDFLKMLFLYYAVFFVVMAPASFLTPLQVVRSFGDEVWRLSAIEIAFSSGMMAGGIIIAYWGGYKNKIHTMLLASLIMGSSIFALGVVPIFWIYLAFMGFAGIAVPFFNTASIVLFQEKVEESFLGRVFGVTTMISTSMMPLGMLIFGPISDSVKIEWMLIGTGIFMFIMGFFLVGNKALRKAGEPAGQDV